MARPSRGWLASVAQTTRKWLGLPVHDAAGRGRRSLAWSPGNPGAVAAMLATQTELRAKSRDIARRNAWANAALESFVSNAIGTGIKPQSMVADQALRESVHRLWSAWVAEADAAGLTDFYGLQALACRAMLEGGECLIRLRPRRPEDGLVVGLQLQLLEPEHLPVTLNTSTATGNTIRAGIEFDSLGRRVAYHLYRQHPEDGALAPMSTSSGSEIRATEAGLYFADDAVHAGLADAVGGFDDTLAEFAQFLSRPVNRLGHHAALLTPTPTIKDTTMSTVPNDISFPNKPAQPASAPEVPEPIDIPDEEIEKVEVAPATPAAPATPTAAAQVTRSFADARLIVEMCALAGRADRALGFLDANAGVDQVRRTLLSELAAAPEIGSLLPPMGHRTSATPSDPAAAAASPTHNPVLAAVAKLRKG